MLEPVQRPLAVHVVTHTHWDREWYRTAEEFRLALVDLVDEVLDGGAGAHFLLDGQAIVLLDYLAVRPERAAEVRDALQSGRVEAGPWFVLGDNLVPGGEALVRNLLTGRAELARLGGIPPHVLYCPDAFGHPAALPRLAAGFAAPLCIVWRGYGGAPWPPGDTVRWRDADGSEVLLHHIAPDGYELGANLPSAPDAAATTWQRLRAVLAPRATTGLILLPNGADHHAVQPRRREAMEALRAVAHPDAIVIGGLGTFAAALGDAARAITLPLVAGELRHSPEHAWSLQGTFGSRAGQKRANAMAERLLVHDVEPACALAWWRDGQPRRHEAHALWRTLLTCHPHDTLCGCSIDAVARAMDRRLDEVLRGGRMVTARARTAWLCGDPAAARDRSDDWRPVATVWNRLPRQRGGLAELEIDEPLGVVPAGPGSAGISLPAPRRRPLRLGEGVHATQELSRELLHVRQESPRHYPRNELVRRRHVLAWVQAVDPMGVRVIPLTRGRTAPPELPHPVVTTRSALDNGVLRATVDSAGRLDVTVVGAAPLSDVLALEVVGDRGDLYTHSPIPGTRVLGRVVRHRLLQRGPLRGALRLTLQARVPARHLTSATGVVRRNRASVVRVTVDVQLDAGARAIVLHAHGDNIAEDCRIRLLLRSGLADADVVADAAFGAVTRPRLAGDDGRGRANEAVVRTAPLHRYVTLATPTRGVTMLSDGLAEYEVLHDGTIAVTLVRAVGELSRHDLPERPGHAGWPVATPEAQSRGPFEGRMALVPHGPSSDEARIMVEGAAEDFLLPLAGETWRWAIDPPPAASGLALSGEGLAFNACKEAEDGQSLVVRCTNLLDRAVAGRWQLAGAREAWLARLDETPLGALTVQYGAVEFVAPPRATVTILLRR